MTLRKRPFFLAARLFPAVLWLTALACDPSSWQVKNGALVPNGEGRIFGFKHSSIALQTVQGYRRKSAENMDPEILFHVLWIGPNTSGNAGDSGAWSSGGMKMEKRISRYIMLGTFPKLRNGRVELQYDGKKQTLSCGGPELKVEGSNLFILRVGEDGKPSLSKLEARESSPDFRDLLKDFAKAVPPEWLAR